MKYKDFNNKGIKSRMVIPIPGESFKNAERKIILNFSEVINSLSNPKDIESIVLFGKSLYKHHQTPEIIKKIKRKYWLFGEKTVKEIEHYKVPKTMNLMVLTNQGEENFRMLESKNPETRSACFINWDDMDHDILERVHDTTEDIPGGVYMHYFNGAPLRINYCPIDTFIEQFANGKEPYKTVAEQGVPIIGQEKFKEVIGQIPNIKRSPLHKFEWSFLEKDSKKKLYPLVRGELK